MDKYQAPTTEYATEVAKNIDLRLQEEHCKSPEEFKNYVTFLMTAFHHTSSPHKIASHLTPEMRETLKKVKQEISTQKSTQESSTPITRLPKGRGMPGWESNRYYLFDYIVPHDVHGDELLTAGSSMVVSCRCVRLTQDKIIFDDVYLPSAVKLSGEWPRQKMVPATYGAISKAYYDEPLSFDYRGSTFELTPSYMHAIQRLPNKRECSPENHEEYRRTDIAQQLENIRLFIQMETIGERVDTKKVCCLCNEEYSGVGHNSSPLKEVGHCCDECHVSVKVARVEKLEQQRDRNHSISGPKEILYWYEKPKQECDDELWKKVFCQHSERFITALKASDPPVLIYDAKGTITPFDAKTFFEEKFVPSAFKVALRGKIPGDCDDETLITDYVRQVVDGGFGPLIVFRGEGRTNFRCCCELPHDFRVFSADCGNGDLGSVDGEEDGRDAIELNDLSSSEDYMNVALAADAQRLEINGSPLTNDQFGNTVLDGLGELGKELKTDTNSVPQLISVSLFKFIRKCDKKQLARLLVKLGMLFRGYYECLSDEKGVIHYAVNVKCFLADITNKAALIELTDSDLIQSVISPRCPVDKTDS